ncbi:MAG TPA: glycoside hydrolase family 36 N-terminal domain-containing protein, partial [Propionicimonas sp.]
MSGQGGGTRVTSYVLLRAEGVMAIVDVTDGRLPAILHWGADLGPLSSADVDALARGAIRTTDGNPVDVPVRLDLLPQHEAGWTGRPGLSGHRGGGAAWSPRFATTSVTVDGAPAAASTVMGRQLHVVAADPVAGLELSL